MTPPRPQPSPPRWVAAHLAVAIGNHLDAQRDRHPPTPWELEVLRDLFAALSAGGGRAAAMPTPPEPMLLTTPQVAEALGLSQSAVKTLMRTKKLRSVLIGGSRRVHVDDLAAYAYDPIGHSGSQQVNDGQVSGGQPTPADDAPTTGKATDDPQDAIDAA